VLSKAKDNINKVQEWNSKTIAEAIKEIGKDLGRPSRVVMQILRYAIAGLESGVGVPVIIEILGRKRVNRRLDTCRSYQSNDEHKH
jgi:glutamyl/glutaminyl-tRNA synthetase